MSLYNATKLFRELSLPLFTLVFGPIFVLIDHCSANIYQKTLYFLNRVIL